MSPKPTRSCRDKVYVLSREASVRGEPAELVGSDIFRSYLGSEAVVPTWLTDLVVALLVAPVPTRDFLR